MTAGICGPVLADRAAARAEADLAAAHAIIHILLTRECGGETAISHEEIKAARGSWITTRIADDGLIVRAR